MANQQESIETKIGRCPISHNNRADIRPLIRQLQEEGFSADAYEGEYIGPSYFGHFAEHKIDLYALTAVIVPRIVDLAISRREQYPPFGLVKFDRENQKNTAIEGFDSHSPFLELDGYMETALGLALYEEAEDGVDHGDDPKLESIYEGYNAIAYLLETIPSYLIYRGINTANLVMSHTLEVIPHVYSREFPDKPYDPSKLSTIARNSYSIIATLAAGHKAIVVRALQILQNGEKNGNHSVLFNPDYFTIRDGKRLDFSDLFRQKVFERFGVWINDFVPQTTPTVGCPALYSDAVKKLWNWYLEIAEVIYRGKEQIIVALKETEPSSRD